jgi:hypothetical protein
VNDVTPIAGPSSAPDLVRPKPAPPTGNIPAATPPQRAGIRYAGVKHNGEEERPWAAVIDARGETAAAALVKFDEAVKIARAQLVALAELGEAG